MMNIETALTGVMAMVLSNVLLFLVVKTSPPTARLLAHILIAMAGSTDEARRTYRNLRRSDIKIVAVDMAAVDDSPVKQ
jgi:hypothetical protein